MRKHFNELQSFNMAPEYIRASLMRKGATLNQVKFIEQESAMVTRLKTRYLQPSLEDAQQWQELKAVYGKGPAHAIARALAHLNRKYNSDINEDAGVGLIIKIMVNTQEENPVLMVTLSGRFRNKIIQGHIKNGLRGMIVNLFQHQRQVDKD